MEDQRRTENPRFQGQNRPSQRALWNSRRWFMYLLVHARFFGQAIVEFQFCVQFMQNTAHRPNMTHRWTCRLCLPKYMEPEATDLVEQFLRLLELPSARCSDCKQVTVARGALTERCSTCSSGLNCAETSSGGIAQMLGGARATGLARATS